MIARDLKLKKKDGFTYIDLTDDKELEWRLGYNHLFLPLKNLTIKEFLEIQNTERVFDPESREQIERNIEPSPGSSRIIRASIDLDEIRDSLFLITPEEDEVFTVKKASRMIEVSILCTTKSVSERTDDIAEDLDEGKWPPGTYSGTIFSFEGLQFEFVIPEDVFNTLVKAVHERPNAEIQANISLLSYSFEVDDFLREYYHSRDLLFEDGNKAPLTGFTISESLGTHIYEDDSEDEVFEDDYSESEPTITPERQSEIDYELDKLKVILLNAQAASRPLAALVWPLWALVGVLVYMAVK